MVKRAGPEEEFVVVSFGGGLHTRPGAEAIGDIEAADGNNFVLDFENKQLKCRQPFDLVGTAPNGLKINGGVSFKDANGNVSMLIQAGTVVYQVTNNGATWTSKGTVAVGAQLRGHWKSGYWALADIALISDLGLVQPVMKWDGTTLSNVSFTNELGAGFGTFYAKYILVSNERAIYANERDVTTSHHLMIGSKTSNYQQISVANSPSTALGADDPFFIITPDLKGVNGLVEAFGTIIVSTEGGQIFALSGTSAVDFGFTPFYAGSAATGPESVSYIGNDVVYGRRGRIESVSDTNRYGDSEFDNIAAGVQPSMTTYSAWTIVYNSRLNRVYAFPTNGSEVWVADTAMLGVYSPLTGQTSQSTSPWMRWRTGHAMAFQPTFVMSMLDPTDGLEYVFMGDSTGHLYRMEGSGLNGDGGTTAITTEWLSKVFQTHLDEQVHSVEGYVSYVKDQAFSISITFRYGGEAAYSETLTVDVPGTAGAIYYNSGLYYNANGTLYFGSPKGVLYRQPIMAPGQDTDFQVDVQVSGVTPWAINEIGLRFGAVGR